MLDNTMLAFEIEAMNGLNIYETGLFWFRNKNTFVRTGPKTTTIRARQIVEASDNEMLICGNVHQTASQTADINMIQYIFKVNITNTITKHVFHNFKGSLILPSN